MGEALVSLGLSADREDRIALRQYYPHATSHFLGLDVHDVGDYQAPLEPGMVLTCEPGIYIPEEGIGVRLEDDVIITAAGARNLSADCAYDAYVL
jgi:Xaa-Pro aminopeptidase